MSNKRFILKKVSSGAEIELTGTTKVGRDPDSGLRLTEGQPSREHALLTLADGAVFVEDLKSTNGTFVNDERIKTRVRLKTDDQLRFDVERYQFRIDWDKQQDRTVVRGGTPDRVAQGGQGKTPPGWINNPEPSGNATLYYPRARPEEIDELVNRVDLDDAFSEVAVPQLVVLKKDERPLRIELRSSDSGAGSELQEWTIGSSSQQDVVLDSPAVSALHAKIIREGVRWRVRDELSSNGTAVNGRSCRTSALEAGDRISFGPIECIFQLPISTGQGSRRSRAKTGSGSRAPRSITRLVAIVIAALLAVTAVVFFYRNSLLN
jgi:pSer/pThr/pTyr-binding forkhead associated (FHA) protein